VDTDDVCEAFDEYKRRLQATFNRRQLLLSNTSKPCYLRLSEVTVAAEFSQISTDVFEHGSLL
jgi:hypothetical protein